MKDVICRWFNRLVPGTLLLAMSSGCAHMETVVHRQFPYRNNQDGGTATVARIDARCGPVYVSEIDGKKVKRDSPRVRARYLERYQYAWFLTGGFGAFSLLQLWPNVDILEVLPGEHTLSVCYYWQTGSLVKRSIVPLYIDMTAQAGHHYRLQGSDTGSLSMFGYGSWGARLEDITGEKPLFIGEAVPRPIQNSSAMNANRAGGGTPSSRRGGGRSAFEQAVKQKMDGGELHTTSLTITYPDGTTRTIKTNDPPVTNMAPKTSPTMDSEEWKESVSY